MFVIQTRKQVKTQVILFKSKLRYKSFCSNPRRKPLIWLTNQVTKLPLDAKSHDSSLQHYSMLEISTTISTVLWKQMYCKFGPRKSKFFKWNAGDLKTCLINFLTRRLTVIKMDGKEETKFSILELLSQFWKLSIYSNFCIWLYSLIVRFQHLKQLRQELEDQYIEVC